MIWKAIWAFAVGGSVGWVVAAALEAAGAPAWIRILGATVAGYFVGRAVARLERNLAERRAEFERRLGDEIGAAVGTVGAALGDALDGPACAHCGGDLEIRNPSGSCDHLRYPENCSLCSDLAAGRRALAVARRREAEIDSLLLIREAEEAARADLCTSCGAPIDHDDPHTYCSRCAGDPS